MTTGVKSTESLEAKRALLAVRLRQQAESSKRIPLSFGQQRLWFLDQLQPGSGLYNIACLLSLTGPLDLGALEHALHAVVSRHEVLRTRFVCEEETPEQVIDPDGSVELRLIDYSSVPATGQEPEIAPLILQEVNRPFKLNADRLIRATLIRLGPQDHRLILVLHHIISDEWSLKLLFAELGTYYRARVSGQPAQLPPLAIQYADYALWQRGWLRGAALEEHLGYWRQQLLSAPALTALPTDRPRGAVVGDGGATVSQNLGPELAGQLESLAKTHGATLFMVLLAGFKALLFRYTQQEDIIVGSPVAGRNRLETEPLIGFFVNTLPLRTDLSGDPSFNELLQRVRETTIGAYAHQDLPFDRLVEELHPERSLSQSPFTNVMFVLQNDPLERLAWSDLQLRFLEVNSGLAKFELTVLVKTTSAGLEVTLEYNRALFDSSTIERWLRHYANLLRGVVADPDRRVSDLPLLSEAERHTLLVQWNDSRTPYPRELTVHRVFEHQAERRSQATAVVYGKESLSYRELNERANQLANYLAKFNLKPGTPIAVCLEPSIDLVVTLIAILKAGAAYVPLDASYPKERLAFMVRDSRAPVLLTRGSAFAAVSDLPVKCVSLDGDRQRISAENRANPPETTTPQNPAYIMYTSGSTGQPKGVVVPHRAINRLVLNTNYIQLDSNDRIAQVSNVSFDAATFEIWGALLNGGVLVGIPREVIIFPKLLARELVEQRATAMFLTAALFNQVAAEVPDAFKGFGTLLVGGEALDPKWVRTVLQHGPPKRLLNGYGPTENTTFTCWHLIREVPPDATQIPIGRPISNTEVYILDPHLHPVPVGVAGELYTGGDGLALGYWERPELTAERFVRCSLKANEPPRLLYRTGDLARFLPGGDIEFLGRRDDQVKVRGFRIELGEIEHVLAGHPDVNQCVVSICRNPSGDKRIVAYVALRPGRNLNAPGLRAFLAERLPEYMLPGAFIPVSSLRLTANGKLDRRSLPSLPEERQGNEKRFVAPRDSIELELSRIWERVLEVRPIGVTDRFFDLGGHSLLAVKVISQIEKAFGKKLRLATIFQSPTIELLAARIRGETPEVGSPATNSLVEIQAGGSLPPLFLVHGAGGGMFWGYVNLARYLGEEQPVYGFKARGLDGGQESGTIEELAAQYLADLRGVQPRGPYYLGGYCFGGIVAYEMACQLTAQGEKVALLALLNCSPPNSDYMHIPWSSPVWVLRFFKNLCYWGGYFRGWTSQQRWGFFRWKLSLLKKRLKHVGDHSRSSPRQLIEAGDLVDLSSFPEDQRRVWEAHIKALVQFHPKNYPGRVDLFRSPGHPLWCSFDPAYGWGKLAEGGVRVKVVPGAHEKILEESCAEVLANDLSEALRTAQEVLPGHSGSCKLSVTEAHTPGGPDPKVNGHQLEFTPNGSVAPHTELSVLEGPKQAFPTDSTYPAQFLRVLERAPAAVAVRCGEQQLTYAELNDRANRLAHYLQRLGVGREVLVAICFERSLDVAVALLAVLKAGGAYLPLDPSYPLDRLSYMLSDSKASLLLRSRGFLPALTANQTQILSLDDELHLAELARCPVTNPTSLATPDNLAYVIYTSGSTGKPKGVQITHRSLLNHNFAIAQAFGLRSSDRILQFAPLSFDISVEEIFPSWLSGCTVVLRSEELVSSVKAFLDFVAKERITVLNLPSAYWHELVASLGPAVSLPESVRLVVVGGEKVSDSMYQLWRQRVPDSVMLVNGYGTTEATVTTTLYTANPQDPSLPLGRPLANTCVVLLDEHLKPVPRGAEGELYIGGAGVGRGYLGRPELTAQRFIRNPFPTLVQAEWFYQTGDLARVRPDGNLEFLGRADAQVKVRGYRIELGEVEAVLEAHPGVKSSAVTVQEDGSGRKRLVAYYVPKGATSPRLNELSRWLRQQLPEYMIPSAFMMLPSLPLSPAGKIDRGALPHLGNERPELESVLVAPRLPLEVALTNIWSEVLGLKTIGVEDNFFDLGGDSLLASQVISRIRDVLQADLLLGQFFSHPTVAKQAQYLTTSGVTRVPELPLSIFDSATCLPLSPNQRHIWLLEQFYPGVAPYNLPVGIKLQGQLDQEALEQSLTALSAAHEALRVVFPSSGGEPMQYLCEPKPVALTIIDLSKVDPEDRERQACQRIEQEARRRYISFHPVLRPLLLRLSETEHWLVLVLHEISTDSRSAQGLIRELLRLYEGLESQGDCLPIPAKISYREALQREGALCPSEERKQLDYWLNQLRDVPPLLDLPSDHTRPARLTGSGARYPLVVAPDQVTRLEQLAQAHGCDLFTILLTGFACLLHRYSQAADFIIGTPGPGKLAPELAEVVANVENPLCLRCDLSGDPGFLEVLTRISRVVDSARAHGEISFARLLELLPVERNGTVARLFRVLFHLEGSAGCEPATERLKVVPFEVENRTAKLDLSLQLTRQGGGLRGWIEYSTDLFDGDRIERMAQHLGVLLESVSANPSCRVSALPLLTDSERHRVIAEWNQTDRPYPGGDTLVSLFAEQAARTPEAEALISGATRLTYRELKEQADRIALELNRLGVTREDLVGVFLDRSPEMIVGLLGTLIAGGAYVPLDPAYPQDRLNAIVEDANLKVILTREEFQGRLSVGAARFLFVENALPSRGEVPKAALPQPLPSDLAYVIYTSGSTGKPKGVALEHRNAVALIHWAGEQFSSEELNGVLASTSICFDLSVFEIFVPLSWGGKIILAENALALPSLPAAREVALINTVPSAIAELLRAKAVPASVRVVNLAGEPLSSALVDQIYRETSVAKVYDLYGPTETTTYSTGTLRSPGAAATIGRPLSNEQVYLLDASLQPVPIGVPGELYIGGAGVARGYLNRPELTAEKFLPSPFQPGRRLYRTGDLARWRRDGNLEYLGRIDHQVKIRGFRIELGEVESVLRTHPAVTEAVVLAREDEPGNKYLVAYVVSAPPNQVAVEELRLRLNAKLPAYMVPSAFLVLESLPLTPNGKVDRKRLPAPGKETRKTRAGGVAARNACEKQLVQIWTEVLHVEQIGVFDNFFDAGGHSLLAAQVVSRIREHFKVDMPLFALFSFPTIAALAQGLAGGQWPADRLPEVTLQAVPRTGLQPVSFVQERLWFLDQLSPGGHAYNVPAAVRLKGKLDLRALQTALNAMIERHEALRTVFEYTAGELFQRVLPHVEVVLASDELSSGPGSNPESEVGRWLKTQAQLPFDLAKGPLLRARLLRLSAADQVFIVVMHHTVCDGWSLTTFFQELEKLYTPLSGGQPVPTLPSLPLQYIDFAHWQRQLLQGATLERELNYWKAKLTGAPSTIDLPLDHPGSSDAAPAPAARKTVWLEPRVCQDIAELGKEQSLTPFMLLMSALLLTLSKWTGQDDLVVGTVVAGRSRRQLENVIGCFMNFLPVRARLQGAGTGQELLNRVRAAVLEGQNHQDCPFEKIVEAVNPQRRLNQNPLYNVALLVQNFPAEPFHSEALNASEVTVDMDAALLDLRFEAQQSANGFSLACEFRTDLFEPVTIDELLTSYVNVLAELARAPQVELDRFTLTTGLQSQAKTARQRGEQSRIAVAATFTAEPLMAPLRYWMRKLKGTPAIEFAPYNQVFQQLLDPASLLAGNTKGLNLLLLRFEDWCGASPIGPATGEGFAGIEKNVQEFILSLRAAAPRTSTPWLVCICPASTSTRSMPRWEEFQTRMEQSLLHGLESTAGVHLLTWSQLAAWYPVEDYSDETAAELAHVPYTPLFFTALATAVARKFHALNRRPYKVIVLDCDQTLWSGVCGEDGPGGICIDAPRQALQSFMRAQHEAGMLLCLNSKNNEEDVRAVFAQRQDMPLRWEHFCGTRLNWQAKSTNLKALAADLKLGLDSFIFLDDNPLECAEVEANCPEVLTLLLPDQPALIPQFLEHCWAFDHLKVTSEDRKRAELYRQNQQREQVRSESVTLTDFLERLELRVSIERMSPGQLPRVAQLSQRTNQFNSTSQRLTEVELQAKLSSSEVLVVQVRDRFGDYGLVGAILYRSDRRALVVDSFLLSCRALGRGVEHRMLARVGEIARGRELDWVDVHFVNTSKNKPALDFLESVGGPFKQALNGGYVFRFPAGFAAEVAFNPGPAAEASNSRPADTSTGAALATAPGPFPTFSSCREIALKSLDLKALHNEIEAGTQVRPGSAGSYVAPRTSVERRLCELWQRVLRIERIGIQDDFFRLGGHSLLAVRLFSEIEKEFGRKLPLVTLFQAPTIEQLTPRLHWDSALPHDSLLVPIQPRGSKAPLFLVHGAGGDVLWGYANLAAHLPPDQPVYGLKSRGQAGLEEIPDLKEMASAYLEAIRSLQKHGPYLLGGYCFGGNVAYEMARQLEAQGEPVALVALLDSAPSNVGYETVPWWRPVWIWRFGCNFFEWLKDFAALDAQDRRTFVARKLRSFLRKWKRRLGVTEGAGLVDLEEVIDPSHFPENELKLWQIHLEALVRHVEEPYSGQVVLLRTHGQPLLCALEPDFCWGKLARGGVEVKIVPGSHENVFVEPHVRALAGELTAALASAQQRPEGKPGGVARTGALVQT